MPKEEEAMSSAPNLGIFPWLWGLFSLSSQSRSDILRENPDRNLTAAGFIMQKLCTCATSLGFLDLLSSLSQPANLCLAKLTQAAEFVRAQGMVFITGTYHTLSSCPPIFLTLLCALSVSAASWYLLLKRKQKSALRHKVQSSAELSMDSSQVSDISLGDSTESSIVVTPKQQSQRDSLNKSEVRPNVGLLGNQVSRALRWMVTLLVAAVAVSIPWEFFRLYQKAVAERAATVLKVYSIVVLLLVFPIKFLSMLS